LFLFRVFWRRGKNLHKAAGNQEGGPRSSFPQCRSDNSNQLRNHNQIKTNQACHSVLVTLIKPINLAEREFDHFSNEKAFEKEIQLSVN
jgi:hypothetical protein